VGDLLCNFVVTLVSFFFFFKIAANIFFFFHTDACNILMKSLELIRRFQKFLCQEKNAMKLNALALLRLADNVQC